MVNFSTVMQRTTNRLFRRGEHHNDDAAQQQTEAASKLQQKNALVVTVVDVDEAATSTTEEKLDYCPSLRHSPTMRLSRSASRVGCVSLDRKNSASSGSSGRKSWHSSPVPKKPVPKKTATANNKREKMLVIKGPAITPRLRYTREKHAELKRNYDRNFLTPF